MMLNLLPTPLRSSIEDTMSQRDQSQLVLTDLVADSEV